MPKTDCDVCTEPMRVLSITENEEMRVEIYKCSNGHTKRITEYLDIEQHK